MKVLLATFALTFAAPAFAVAPTHMMPKLAEGRVVAWSAVDGGAAGPMTIWIWLPPEYDSTQGERFPVLYMHDGQNLVDKSLTQ